MINFIFYLLFSAPPFMVLLHFTDNPSNLTLFSLGAFSGMISLVFMEIASQTINF